MRKKTLLFLMVVFTILSLSNILHAQEGALCDLYGTVSEGEAFQYRTPPQPRLFLNDYPPTGPAMREPDMVWVENTLSSMTLDEKIGQMIFPGSAGNEESLINQYRVGGFAFTGNDRLAADLISITNSLQAYSPIPLLFAIDSEAGLGARVLDSTRFPLNMAFGAINDPSLTEMCGRITARESRALGIQISFAPVVDVNTEPRNSIISTRSFSDVPGLVTRLARGYIKGAKDEGLLCCLKHYPGHGPSAADSHVTLPVIDIPYEAMQKIHLYPYTKIAGNNEVFFVMTAHVSYSAVYPDTPWPATLSSIFLTDILRNQIGYYNLIISDAFGMSGVAVTDQVEMVITGVESGLDIILMPSDVGVAANAIKQGISNGRIPESRVDESVRKILIVKSRVGLPELKMVDPTGYQSILRHPVHLAKVREVCEKAFTCGKNDLGTSPTIKASDRVLILDLAASSKIFYRMASSYFTNPFKTALPATQSISVKTTISTTSWNNIVNSAAASDKVIILGYDWYKIMSNDQVNLINTLTAKSTPVIYISFGAPYHYAQIPDVDAFYCGYASVDAMQEVAVDVLTGKLEQKGGIPVCIPGLDALCSTTGWFFYF